MRSLASWPRRVPTPSNRRRPKGTRAPGMPVAPCRVDLIAASW
jgi:hypothetical protein